jgi:23S rRNA U2552 (ribose-2'-O)-methylase RlmE/FtsJ
METKGIYIYGIVPNSYGTERFSLLKNLGVNFISFDNISAIVSDKEIPHIDFLDRESLAHLLVHHQKIIEGIMAIGFNMILPMKLGTFVNANKDVLSILENAHDLMITTLNKIEFLTEIDMVVTWGDLSGILNEISAQPDIIAIKDEILKKTDTLSQSDMVKVGMLVQKKLNEKNKTTELKFLDALASFCLDVKIHEVMNDQMLTNSAFLINFNKKEEFEQVIDQLDEEFKGLLNFKLVGPLPCYSFFTIEIKELNPEHVALAKKELGLSDDSTKSEVKEAYIKKAKLFHPDAFPNKGEEEKFNIINNAYRTLLEYYTAVSQSSGNDSNSPVKEKELGNLILVKIKE